jgi:transketolase
VYPKADKDWKKTAQQGAYIVKEAEGKPELVIVATGSEVSLALKAVELSGKKNVRVVSMLCREQFLAQKEDFRKNILPSGVRTIVAELGSSQGWEGFVQSSEDLFTLDDFGLSGPGEQVAEALGRSEKHLAQLINR